MICCSLLFGCHDQSNKKYDQQDRLFAYLQKEHIDFGKKTVLLVLQRELCSCTVDDTQLSYDILTSPKFNSYNRILIVPDSTHSIVARLKLTQYYNKIKIISNNDDALKKNGLVFAVNRLFLLDKNEIIKTVNMHLTNHNDLRSQLL